jgi:hypothetical protein
MLNNKISKQIASICLPLSLIASPVMAETPQPQEESLQVVTTSVGLETAKCSLVFHFNLSASNFEQSQQDEINEVLSKQETQLLIQNAFALGLESSISETTTLEDLCNYNEQSGKTLIANFRTVSQTLTGVIKELNPSPSIQSSETASSIQFDFPDGDTQEDVEISLSEHSEEYTTPKDQTPKKNLTPPTGFPILDRV